MTRLHSPSYAAARRRQKTEFGMRTRRRPIERDYAAAKDAEVGKRTKYRVRKITAQLS